MGFQAQEQNEQNFIFKDAREVAILATRVGMSVSDFVKLYWDNMNEATQNSWHTAIRFKAKIEEVVTEVTSLRDKEGQPIQKAIVHYSHGYEGKRQSLAINGLLTEGYKAQELYKQAKSLIGHEVLLYRGYDKNKYAVIIRIDPFGF